MKEVKARWIDSLLDRVEEFGRFMEFNLEVMRSLFKKPFRMNRYLEEVEHLGINSVPVILLSGLAIGMIFALQMVSLLQPFKAEIGVGAAVAVALGREFAPIITSLMLIAKNGSAMAAEIGTMRVTDQIDALESMSVNVGQYLVLPRVIASVLVYPCLTMVANVIGVLGAWFISVTVYQIDRASYLAYMFNVLKPKDIYIGLIKAAVMGYLVSMICCWCGLNSGSGAKGVGDGATRAVVLSSVSILVADYLLATIMMTVVFK